MFQLECSIGDNELKIRFDGFLFLNEQHSESCGIRKEFIILLKETITERQNFFNEETNNRRILFHDNIY